MNDQDIQVFITGVRRYFESLRADIRVVIEPPFIKDEEKPFLEYTGIIGISGKTHGAVCFTANGGNAREEFGRDFLISVPIVSRGGKVRFQFPQECRNYVIPIIWQTEKAYLLVCLT
jgi:chemotaxis protein CheX